MLLRRAARNGTVVWRTFTDDARADFIRRIEENRQPSHPRLTDKVVDSTMSVLIPLVEVNGRRSVLLTKRSVHLRSHRGEVCFPGGRSEPGETPQQTALRETKEEIGLQSEAIEVWGLLRGVLTRFLDSSVTPMVGWVRDVSALQRLAVNAGEVQAVFSIPIDEAIESVRYTQFNSSKLKYRLPVFRSRQFVTHYNAPGEYLHDEQRVWGLSAVMLHQALIVIEPDAYKSPVRVLFN